MCIGCRRWIGIRIVDAWMEHENVTAVIFAHLPGQDTGHAAVELLYGRENPSGRSLYPVARRAEDYGSLLFHSKRKGRYWLFLQFDLNQGLLTDYRAFDTHDITPHPQDTSLAMDYHTRPLPIGIYGSLSHKSPTSLIHRQLQLSKAEIRISGTKFFLLW